MKGIYLDYVLIVVQMFCDMTTVFALLPLITVNVELADALEFSFFMDDL